MSQCPCPPQRVLIIGGGEFGLSAAYALATSTYEGFEHLITVVDPSPDPPTLDAASSDLNKIVRSDYCDPLYSTLAREALERWRSPTWKEYYSESGILVMADLASESSNYVRSALEMNKSPVNGRAAYELETPQAIKGLFPAKLETADFENVYSYFNPNCGWTDARGAMEILCQRVRELGVQFLTHRAKSLIYCQGDIKGVVTEEGITIKADFTILAAGSWSSALLPELGDQLLSTGQVIGTIQLSDAEAAEYRAVPVCFEMGSGFYVFPPNRDNIVKFAIHGPGYLNPDVAYDSTSKLASTPRTKNTPLHMQDNIPREAVTLLRTCLVKVYPRLADKPWIDTRLCWYADTPSSNFLLDYHPDHPSLFLATGGSGHAFKFLPVMGDLILASLQRTCSAEKAAAWSFVQLKTGGGDASRGGSTARKLLRSEDMAGPEDLMPKQIYV